MDKLLEAIRTTPIIDNHAHPLLRPAALAKHPLLSITTEAHGHALQATTSSLPHIRAVKPLSEILGCEESWDAVVKAIETERQKPNDAWSRRCLDGIETILIDDGLDRQGEVFDIVWHDRLTRKACKRIVRIEKVAETIISKRGKSANAGVLFDFATFDREFKSAIVECLNDSEVVGFKSVICYRIGLDIPAVIDQEEIAAAFSQYYSDYISSTTASARIEASILNAYLVHTTAILIRDSPQKHKRPFQFHTGLGDNDITLTRSSPAHLQGFIKVYPTVPVVLLHASYPWTEEAAYLASVYENVFADIGEVFPMISREGQENVVREVMELCPTEKVLWSTDGHWFPETYFLAVVQVREVLSKILQEYVHAGDLNIEQAIQVVENILFNTSNRIYDLKLKNERSSRGPLPDTLSSEIFSPAAGEHVQERKRDLQILRSFLDRHPKIKYLRVQYVDYTSSIRMRSFPMTRVVEIHQKKGEMAASITKASLGLLQNDTVFPHAGSISCTGEYQLLADVTSIRAGPSEGYATAMADFKEQDGGNAVLCPRTVLADAVERARKGCMTFLIGFEIEIVFLEFDEFKQTYITSSRLGQAHTWGSARAYDTALSRQLLDEIIDSLAEANISLEYFHPESAHGQYEFVLPPLPPIEAVDTLILAREIIIAVANKHNLRATLHPKPSTHQAGTASHIHLSIYESAGNSTLELKQYESFYAGILQHLPAILAFSYPQEASYQRMNDSCWAGGTWVCWGTQNRETALRKIEDSHWEIKVVDGLANPYFTLAAIICAGINGLRNQSKLQQKDCQVDPATLSDNDRKGLNITNKLPSNLNESLIALKSDLGLTNLLGQTFVERYLNSKYAEIALLDSVPEAERRDWIIARY